MRVDLQEREHHVADDRAADRRHALVGRGEGPPGGEADRAAQVVVVERPEILREDRVLLQLLRRRGGGVVDAGEFQQRGIGHGQS